jgi:predicted nucleic acid-binding protein
VTGAAALKIRGASSNLITTDHVVGELWRLLRAGQISRKRPDQDFSPIDCASFAVMKRPVIDAGFAFDVRFRRRGLSRRKEFWSVP